MTATATNVMLDAWQKGIEDRSNPFDEPIEQMWVRQWLFYANSVRSLFSDDRGARIHFLQSWLVGPYKQHVKYEKHHRFEIENTR